MRWAYDLINDLTLRGRPVENSQMLGGLTQATTPSGGGHVIVSNNTGGGFSVSDNDTWTIRGNSIIEIDPYTGRPTLCTQLMMRLDPTGKHKGTQLFEFINVHKCRDDLYAVFVVKNGKPLIIEDGDLFPSDMLITKLRLMIG